MAETKSCSADADHGAAPGCEFGEYAGHHTAAHAAKGRAADIKPHGEAEPARMDLFGEIGHGDRRCAAERYALSALMATISGQFGAAAAAMFRPMRQQSKRT